MEKLRIRADSANDAWVRLIRKIRDCGQPSKPRGLRILELLAHTTHVDMARPVVTIEKRKMGFRFLAAEAHWILTGRNDVASIAPYSKHIASFSNADGYFDGAYGVKIVDQLRYVLDSLVKDVDTRQAVATIWRENPRDSRDIPCTIAVQWMVRDGELHCFDTMRSSDAWLGIVYDWFNFSMLSAYVLLLLRERDPKFKKIGLGALHLTAGSQHLYVNPKEDGNYSIPYSLEDIDKVLEDCATIQSLGIKRHCPECLHQSRWYEPLDVDEFSSSRELLDFLASRKDRGECGKEFLKEILGI